MARKSKDEPKKIAAEPTAPVAVAQVEDAPDDRETESPEVTAPPDEEAPDDGSLTPAQRELNRLSKRPRIDHLQPGTVTDPETGERLPLFDLGDRIIVERCTDLLKGVPWLDTRLYVVVHIDDDTGAVRCTDPEFNHQAVVSFKSPFHRIVIPPPRGNPFAAPRTRQAPVNDGPKPEGKRGRGRPKGTKNRPKEVIAAEKAERSQQRSAGIRRRGRKTK